MRIRCAQASLGRKAAQLKQAAEKYAALEQKLCMMESVAKNAGRELADDAHARAAGVAASRLHRQRADHR